VLQQEKTLNKVKVKLHTSPSDKHYYSRTQSHIDSFLCIVPQRPVEVQNNLKSRDQMCSSKGQTKVRLKMQHKLTIAWTQSWISTKATYRVGHWGCISLSTTKQSANITDLWTINDLLMNNLQLWSYTDTMITDNDSNQSWRQCRRSGTRHTFYQSTHWRSTRPVFKTTAISANCNVFTVLLYYSQITLHK